MGDFHKNGKEAYKTIHEAAKNSMDFLKEDTIPSSKRISIDNKLKTIRKGIKPTIRKLMSKPKHKPSSNKFLVSFLSKVNND